MRERNRAYRQKANRSCAVVERAKGQQHYRHPRPRIRWQSWFYCGDSYDHYEYLYWWQQSDSVMKIENPTKLSANIGMFFNNSLCQCTIPVHVSRHTPCPPPASPQPPFWHERYNVCTGERCWRNLVYISAPLNWWGAIFQDIRAYHVHCGWCRNPVCQPS